MNNERFQILKLIGGLALLVPAVVGVIEIFGFFTTASSKLSATVESASYRIHPNLQSYVKKAFEQEIKSSGESKVIESTKGSGFLSNGEDFGEVIFNLEFQGKHGAGLGVQRFSTYKVVNSGDKAALDARLVNVAGSMAVIEGQKDPIEIQGKAAIDLGRLDPRSTKTIYVWSRLYIDVEDGGPFVQYDGGAVDVERLIVVGGVYKHLHDYGMRYLTVILTVLLIASSVVVSSAIRNSTSGDDDVPAPKAKRRRSRRRKPNQNTSNPEARD